MPIRNGVLARGFSNGTSPQTLATVPSTDTWIVKSVLFYNTTASSITATLGFANAASSISGLFFNQAIAGFAIAAFNGWVAGGPGDQLNLYSVTVSGLEVWVSGADLPGHL